MSGVSPGHLDESILTIKECCLKYNVPQIDMLQWCKNPMQYEFYCMVGEFIEENDFKFWLTERLLKAWCNGTVRVKL